MKLIQIINTGWDIVHAALSGIWMELHKGKLIRRFVLGFAVYIQYQALMWSMAFLSNLPTGVDGLSAAAMVAAVLTPISGLLGAAIKFYNDARKDDTSFKDQ